MASKDCRALRVIASAATDRGVVFLPGTALGLEAARMRIHTRSLRAVKLTRSAPFEFVHPKYHCIERLPLEILTCFGAALVAETCIRAGDLGLVNTARPQAAHIYMTDLGDAKWTGGLWGSRFDVCRNTMVSHMWNKSDEESHE